jgi:hypothetical protein
MPSDEPECTEHVDANADGKCDNCGADVEIKQPENNQGTDENKGEGNEEVKLTYAQKLAKFFRSIIDAITKFFAGLFGKK